MHPIKSPKRSKTHHKNYYICKYDTNNSTSRIRIKYHTKKSYQNNCNNKIPLSKEPSKICKYPTKNDEKSPHCIRSIENSLKSSHIRTVNSMKNWRCSTKIPSRRIPRITKIEENILRKGPFKESAEEYHYSWWY